jgi:hypothetical protein
MSTDGAAGRGDVAGAGPPVQADRQVPQHRHDRWAMAGPDLERSSVKVTSRTQCSRFSIPQCDRSASASSAAVLCATVSSVMA